MRPGARCLFLDLDGTELFLARQVVNTAQKHPANPVLIPGNVEDWDSDRASNWAATIAWDPNDRMFKAWYYGIDLRTTTSPSTRHAAIGYAVSADGVYWEKPRLGLYDYDGSTDNNICFRPPSGEANHFCVVIDPLEQHPERRYQALAWMAVPGADTMSGAGANVFEGTVAQHRYVAHHSKDGIHWQQSGNGVVWPAGDTGQILIDPTGEPSRRFLAYGQHNGGAGPDIEHLEQNPQNAIDPADGLEHEIHFVSVLPYHGNYVMLYDFNRYRPYHGHWGYHRQGELNITRQERVKQRVALTRGELPPEAPEDRYGIYTGDIRLAFSNDPLGRFQRLQPRAAVVERGERPEWDSGFLVLGGGSLIEHDDQIYIFYTGINETSAAAFTGAVPGRVCTGLATLRRDGFAHVQAADSLCPGTVTTRPIEVSAERASTLFVNAAGTIPWRDWIEVEVVEADTQRPLHGYSRSESLPIMADGVQVPVRWREHAKLEVQPVGAVRLRFHLYGRARLYSFGFLE